MARRKTIKKQEYESFPNCMNGTEEWKGRWKDFFGNDGKLVLELGCGKAELIYTLAQKYPQINYLGVDLKMDRMWRPAKEALKNGIHNMAFLCIHLIEIQQHFEENEVDEIWITFPDPFPKNKQAKHRMINPPFLRQYQYILKSQGTVHFKTDNLDLFHYSLELFVREQNIRFHALSFDLHEDKRMNEELKIETTYERAFRQMGKKINYVSFTFI
jgi:tRNA (guanine-N7-)-methyltransferase